MSHPAHHQQAHAGTRLAWYPYDDAATYVKNLRSRHSDLVRLGWINANITYQFNSAGFRCDEFVHKSVMFLGCSMTFGIGLPLHQLWTTRVSSALNLPCANLAVSGSSNDTAFRMAQYWVKQIRPCMAILMSPDASRMELLKTHPVHYRVNAVGVQDQFYSTWLNDPENSRLNQLKNQWAIAALCHAQGVKFHCYSVSHDFCTVPDDWARDLSHPGAVSHQLTADKILATL